MNNDDKRMDFGLDAFQPIEDVQRIESRHVKQFDRIHIKDADGSVREYDSMEDLPPELRADLEKAFSEAAASGPMRSEVRLNVNGQEQHFQTWDDVPSDLRTKVMESMLVGPGIANFMLDRSGAATASDRSAVGVRRGRARTERAGRGWFWTGCQIFAVLGTLYLIWYLVNWIGGVYFEALEEAQPG